MRALLSLLILVSSAAMASESKPYLFSLMKFNDANIRVIASRDALEGDFSDLRFCRELGRYSTTLVELADVIQEVQYSKEPKKTDLSAVDTLRIELRTQTTSLDQFCDGEIKVDRQGVLKAARTIDDLQQQIIKSLR